MNWLEEQSKTVEREVVSREWEGQIARVVLMRRIYPTEQADLWDAIVTPERLVRWFLPISGELHVGGRYQLEGNAGGTIRECDPPNSLALTWEMFGSVGWVNVSLEAIDETSTRLTLEHIGHEDPTFMQFWDQYGAGATGVGWDLGLTAFAEYIATGDVTFAADEETWVKTDQGQLFIREACDGWIAAEIEFGTDAKQSQLAGDRSYGFYTGT